MKKIISLFRRNYDTDHLVRDEVVPGAEWVIAGEGIATQKFDGTACLVRDGKLYKRFDAKKGKVPPDDFIPSQNPDPVTGHWPGWVQITESLSDRWHREAFDDSLPDGTYELIGPKVQGNPHGHSKHALLRHGVLTEPDAPRTFDALKEWFKDKDFEGLVWHHPDRRMVKIKKRDFGYE